MAVTGAYQGVMEPPGIRRRRWSRVMAVTGACQRVQTCRPKFGWSPISVEVRMEIICRGISIKTCNRSSGRKFGSCGSPDEVYLQSESGMKSGSRRSPDEVYLQLKSEMKSDSRRSPNEVYL